MPAPRPAPASPTRRHVLVPVANPASLRPLLRCARRLAGGDGAVTLLTVLTPQLTTTERRQRRSELASAAARAQTRGPPQVHARTIESEHVAEGVLHAAQELDASLVLMGWRGASSTSDVFGQMIDEIVGRSSSPLAILRPGSTPVRRVVFPVSPDHLLPGGAGGLRLAIDLAERLRRHTCEPTTVLRTGVFTSELPVEVTALGDRVHHDYRRIHHAVGAFAGPGDVVVAPVAPTVSGLRAATTHLAWSTPEAELLVAIDSGRIRGRRVVDAVSRAGQPGTSERSRPGDVRNRRVAVTIRLAESADAGEAERSLSMAGRTDHLMSWWPPNDAQLHLGATVHVRAATANDAIATVATRLRDAPCLAGADISYAIEGLDADPDPTPRTRSVSCDPSPAEGRT